MRITNRVDDAHRELVRSLPCCVCGRSSAPSEFCHVRFREFQGMSVPVEDQGGTGLKPHDKWSVPMCHQCHAAQHAVGERRFWEGCGVNPLAVAKHHWDERVKRASA